MGKGDSNKGKPGNPGENNSAQKISENFLNSLEQSFKKSLIKTKQTKKEVEDILKLIDEEIDKESPPKDDHGPKI